MQAQVDVANEGDDATAKEQALVQSVQPPHFPFFLVFLSFLSYQVLSSIFLSFLLLFF